MWYQDLLDLYRMHEHCLSIKKEKAEFSHLPKEQEALYRLGKQKEDYTQTKQATEKKNQHHYSCVQWKAQQSHVYVRHSYIAVFDNISLKQLQ